MTLRSGWIRPSLSPWFRALLGSLALASGLAAQVGTVASEQKISETAGGFGGVLNPGDIFGESVAALGDLDGDGNQEIAVGAPWDDDDGNNNQGAVWILSLNADGSVASELKIYAFSGAPSDFYGFSVAALGDLDGDGIQDLAVGAYNSNQGGAPQGKVWILFLNADGSVASEWVIFESFGGFGGALDPGDNFGIDVAALGDLDGDGNEDLAVGASGDDDGGSNQGAIWILFLNANGTVASEQKISETAGGFGGVLDPSDFFGRSVASLGDLDGDGNGDLAVGAYLDDHDDNGIAEGAVWILFLNADGTVASEQKLSAFTGGFGGVLDPGDRFGVSVAGLGDLDGDGNQDLAVGADEDDDGGSSQGAVWILFLNADGTVASEQKISETAGGFGGDLDPSDVFGSSVAALGDLDGDGNQDLAVGADGDDDGDNDQGAVWILFLEGPETPPRHLRRPTPPVPFVLPTPVNPFSVGTDGPCMRRADLDETLPPAEPRLFEFTAPRGESQMLIQVAGDRVEISDGVESYVLYESEPGDKDGSLSLFADLSLLFPRSTSETMFHLAGATNLRLHGGASLRNGSGVNEVSFFSASTPRAGEAWQAWVDVSPHPTATASLVVVSDRPLAGITSPFGEILLDVLSRKPLFTSLVASNGATDVHVFPIPAELVGRSYSLQALILEEGRSALTNALDIRIAP